MNGASFIYSPFMISSCSGSGWKANILYSRRESGYPITFSSGNGFRKTSLPGARRCFARTVA